MNREIFRIALPAIIANITIPLLGLADTAIAGHLGGASFIGAMAVATMMFNLIYWNFGFLRMGTSGLTAQCYGADDREGSARILVQSSATAVGIGLAIMIFQTPLLRLSMWVISPSEAVTSLAVMYYRVVVWGAVPTLLMMPLKGWLLGMQDSKGAMMVSIVVNVLNIVVSLVAAFGMGLGFWGVAVGTVVAQWLGLAYSLLLVARGYSWLAKATDWHKALRFEGSRKLFALNGSIFVRSFLLMLVNLAVVAIGARSGDLILAVNAIIQQLNTLYAYFTDGIAFAGEALVGKYVGRGDRPTLQLTVKRLFLWSGVLTIAFTLFYAFPQFIMRLLTDDSAVLAAAMDYRWWCALLPVAGMAAFTWDGIFIGMAWGKGMLASVAVAGVLFAVLYFALPVSMGNHRLWLAFVLYLFARGAVQTWLYFRKSD